MIAVTLWNRMMDAVQMTLHVDQIMEETRSDWSVWLSHTRTVLVAPLSLCQLLLLATPPLLPITNKIRVINDFCHINDN